MTARATLDQMMCFALYSVERRIGAVYRELLEPWQLSYTQYLVLIALWNDGRLTVGELGELLGLDSGTLSPLLKRLEGRGLLTRGRRTDDERIVEVALTATGVALRSELADIPACFAERLELGEADAVALRDRARALSDTLAAGR